MPVDLPVRKALNSHSGVPQISDEWAVLLIAVCFVVVLVGLISYTPRTFREGLSATVYEGMLQSP